MKITNVHTGETVSPAYHPLDEQCGNGPIRSFRASPEQYREFCDGICPRCHTAELVELEDHWYLCSNYYGTYKVRMDPLERDLLEKAGCEL